MFRNYVITAWRNIIKNGMFSFINIFGLALGLMCCILIMLFVREESGFDTWLKDSERVVRLHTAFFMPDRSPFITVRSAGRMMAALRDYAKNEIEDGVRLLHFNTTVQKDGDAFAETITLADGSFFNVFALPFSQGSPQSSFRKPFDLVISERLARKYFGKTEVIGETMTLCCIGDSPTTLPITGVFKDLPDATHLDLNMLVYLQPSMFDDQPNILNTWTSVNVYTYFKMRPGVSVEQLQQRIYHWVNNESPFVQMVKERMGGLPKGMQLTDIVKHRVMALPDLHLHAKEQAGNISDMTPMGDYQMIVTFSIVAGLILLIACINFMNLATARASQRAKEVALRKVMGASRSQVALQFLGESIALVLLALVFALVAVELVLPLYNTLLGRELELHLFSDRSLLFSLLGIALLVGVCAGLYPALYLSRYLPAHILRASKGSESGGSATLRTALVVLQFATSIALVVSTAVIYGQTLYSNNIDVGYVSNNKLVLDISNVNGNGDSLKQALLSLPQISSVAFSSEVPSQDHENNTEFKRLQLQQNSSNDQPVLLNYHNMGYGFFEAYGIKPVAGRLFNEAFGTDQLRAAGEGETGSANILLNMSAVKKLGFTSAEQAIGQTLAADVFRAGQQQLTIVGVIPDIYFRSLKFSVRPSVYMMDPARFHMASITFNSSNVPALISKITEVWKRNVPMQPVDLSLLDDMMQAQYASEQAQAKLFAVFSLLAIIVACLGLYGLAAFTAERRTKEIGVRKVMGARVRDIISLLIWQFSKPVLLANLLAWPVAIYLMQNWLAAFPYRLDSIWLLPICLIAGGSALLIAWLTVGGNAAKVARANPIKALRYE